MTDQINAALGAMQTAIDSRPVVVGVVLDRSGSMMSIKKPTIDGFNEFLGEQTKLPGNVLLSLTQFDTSFDVIHDMVPLDQVPMLTDATFVPRGGTALFDAIGVTVASIEKSIANLPEEPARVVLVIMTDGGENSSKEYTKDAVNALIEDKRNKRKNAEPWDIVFLGANQDAFAAGNQMGVARDATSNYAATAAGTKAVFAGVSSYVGRSRTYASRGVATANAFSPEERNQMENPE